MTASLSTSRLRTVDIDQARYLDRWLKVWVILLAVVVLVVVFYLIFITDSLAAINKNLGATQAAVVGAGGHVTSLPGQINDINTSLTSINSALAPIHGQAGQIIGDLSSINGSLTSVNSSLISTSGLLSNTAGSLVNTSSVLTNVLSLARNINSELDSAYTPAAAIVSQLGVANPALTAARSDTSNIGSSQVPGINGQLSGICQGPVVKLVDNLSSVLIGHGVSHLC